MVERAASAEPAATAAGDRPPAVLFADDGDWDCFFHLSAQLRRAGIKTLRLTTVHHRRYEDVFGGFDHTVRFPDPAELDRLRSIMASYTIIDVQPTETMAEAAYAAVGSLDGQHDRRRWAARPAVIDKLTIAATLRAAGLRVPDVLVGVVPSEAVATFGLPLVTKERVGNGGGGVHVVNTVAELDAVKADADIAGNEIFYERFLPGEQFSFGGLATEDGVVMGAIYAVLGRATALAPPTAVESVDAPEIDDIARAVVAATGLLGLLNLNLIRDADGAYSLHDVNPRAWGTMPTCSAFGADFGAAYVRWLKGESVEPTHSKPGIGPVSIYPGALRVVPRVGGERRAFVRWLLGQRKTCGWRFIAAEIARARQLLGSVPQL